MIPATIALLPALPLLAAGVTAVAGWRRATAWLGPLVAAVVAVTGALLAAQVLQTGPRSALAGLVRVDPLSALMVILIGCIALLATSYGLVTWTEAPAMPATRRSYGALMQLLVAAMLMAVLASNVGVLWVAVEATTLTTVFLVGLNRTRNSLEASWKYVVIGSVGVALALLGTLLVYLASSRAGHPTLDWTALVALGPHLDPGVLRLALGLLVLGFGTKAGLAPMHTWVADAYSQAPAPVAALMSGALSSVAIYALLRYRALADAALGPDYFRGLLAAGALVSLVVAASLLIAQRDLRRMLAYSSIEHIGVATLGCAIGGPLATGAALLHLVGHGLAKSVTFCASGEILATDGTVEIASVQGLLARQPFTGATFGAGLAALLGLPPFSLFISELAIARAGFAAHLGWLVMAASVPLLVIFGAVVSHACQVLLGAPLAGRPAGPPTRPVPLSRRIPLVAGLGASTALGLSAWPVAHLLAAAAQVVVR